MIEQDFLKDFELGISLFNEKEFYLAHESFEDSWRKCTDSRRLFLQGLVQISVGFFHYSKNDLINSVSQFKKAIVKLETFSDKFMNIDNLELINNLKSIIIDIEVQKSYINRNNKLNLIKIKFCI